MVVSADLRLVRLLQLASPALPVGAYSYSGGLEMAIEDGCRYLCRPTRWNDDGSPEWGYIDLEDEPASTGRADS